MRQRKLGCLRIYSGRAPYFDQAFGQQTQQVIMDLVSDIHSLQLKDIVIPAAFMEKLPPLKYIYLRNVSLTSPGSLSQVPPPVFTDTSDFDVGSLQGISQFYQRSQQPIPAYVNFAIEFTPLFLDHSSLPDMLSGSIHSLRSLIIHPPILKNENHFRLELGAFRKLTSLQLKLRTVIQQSAWEVLLPLNLQLASIATVLGFPTPPSKLVNVSLEIELIGTPRSLEGCTHLLSSAELVNGLDRKDLLPKHPELKLITIKICPPQTNSFWEDRQDNHLFLAFKNIVGRYIRKVLPNSHHVRKQELGRAIVHNISLDSV
ncbi:hypothetical protein CPB83DRAFT_861500 [Crepidotus variabilis]|uniref:Uncharacterized protein n=1 Tax=Crepidotus variabilis TaxID=179855 RepID=A0A9P6E7U5_9AGAR|nr:hypothetical protein CPB83DRAFT_861500 [Crepidotus variabilis]